MIAVFLTGQSNRRSCQLSPIQRKLADLLEQQGFTVTPLNFPYDSQMEDYQESNLFKASLSNGLQYLFSRRATFSARYREQVLNQFSKNTPYLVLAGSCGLELLNNLQLPENILSKIHVLAYGPVARVVPAAEVTLVQGRDDWLSKQFFKNVDYPIDCGHMDYLESAEVTTLIVEIAKAIKRGQTSEEKTN